MSKGLTPINWQLDTLANSAKQQGFDVDVSVSETLPPTAVSSASHGTITRKEEESEAADQNGNLKIVHQAKGDAEGEEEHEQEEQEESEEERKRARADVTDASDVKKQKKISTERL